MHETAHINHPAKATMPPPPALHTPLVQPTPQYMRHYGNRFQTNSKAKAHKRTDQGPDLEKWFRGLEPGDDLHNDVDSAILISDHLPHIHIVEDDYVYKEDSPAPPLDTHLTPTPTPEIIIIDDTDDTTDSEKSHGDMEDVDMDQSISESMGTGSSSANSEDAVTNIVGNDILPAAGDIIMDNTVVDDIILDDAVANDVTEHAHDKIDIHDDGDEVIENTVVDLNVAEESRAASDASPIRTHINPYHRLILSQRRKDREKVSPCSHLLALVNSLTKSIKEARGCVNITNQLIGGQNKTEQQLTKVANESEQLPINRTDSKRTESGTTCDECAPIDDDSDLEPPPSQVSSAAYTYYLRFPPSLSPSPPPSAQPPPPEPVAENPLVSIRVRTLWDDIMANYYDSDSSDTGSDCLNTKTYSATSPTLLGTKDGGQSPGSDRGSSRNSPPTKIINQGNGMAASASGTAPTTIHRTPATWNPINAIGETPSNAIGETTSNTIRETTSNTPELPHESATPRSAIILRRSGRTHTLTEKAVQAESQRAQAVAEKIQRAKIAERTRKRQLIIQRLLAAPEYTLRFANSSFRICVQWADCLQLEPCRNHYHFGLAAVNLSLNACATSVQAACYLRSLCDLDFNLMQFNTPTLCCYDLVFDIDEPIVHFGMYYILSCT